MCNLFANTLPVEAMRRLFAVSLDHDRLGNAEPLPAIFPKGRAPVVLVGRDGERNLVNSHWGFLLPQKSKVTGDPIQPKAVNNARNDKLRTSAFWKASFENRRCLLPATSFCEAKGRKPATYVWFGMASGEGCRPPFAFAGIWRDLKGWSDAQEIGDVASSMITTKPNDLVKETHPDRMPVILDPSDYETWLCGSPDEAFDLLRPFPAESMTIHQSGENLKSDVAG